MEHFSASKTVKIWLRGDGFEAKGTPQKSGSPHSAVHAYQRYDLLTVTVIVRYHVILIFEAINFWKIPFHSRSTCVFLACKHVNEGQSVRKVVVIIASSQVFFEIGLQERERVKTAFRSSSSLWNRSRDMRTAEMWSAISVATYKEECVRTPQCFVRINLTATRKSLGRSKSEFGNFSSVG